LLFAVSTSVAQYGYGNGGMYGGGGMNRMGNQQSMQNTNNYGRNTKTPEQIEKKESRVSTKPWKNLLKI